MTEKRVEVYMLERLEGEQKTLTARVDSVDASLKELGREAIAIKGLIKPPAETPAWVKYIVYPLCVLGVAGIVTSVVTLTVQMHGLQVFLHENGGFIAGLKLQHEARPNDPKWTGPLG